MAPSSCGDLQRNGSGLDAFESSTSRRDSRQRLPLIECSLAGGITNQEDEVEQCLQIARALERGMVLPRPFASTRSVYAGGRGEISTDAFDALWDARALVACSSERYGVDVVEDASSFGGRPGLEFELTEWLENWTFWQPTTSGPLAAAAARYNAREGGVPSMQLAWPRGYNRKVHDRVRACH